tara:strand:- start:348 stop:1106 length:759 start_codon:yes stop_codon:yes gene_type:complete
MNFKNLLSIFFFLFLSNCTVGNVINNKPDLDFNNTFSNKGFALIFDNTLYENDIISNKLDERDLIIFQRNLKKNTQVKITNILNNKSILARVGKKTDYPLFNNSVISIRIANKLLLNKNEPYIKIEEISNNSLFIVKKAKTFEEEKKVANKVPVSIISIDDLNTKKSNDIKAVNNEFSYLIKVVDFYFEDTAQLLIKRIHTETGLTDVNIKKISDRKYRVFLGPFSNIRTLQKTYNSIKILKFENIEIIKND